MRTPLLVFIPKVIFSSRLSSPLLLWPFCSVNCSGRLLNSALMFSTKFFKDYSPSQPISNSSTATHKILLTLLPPACINTLHTIHRDFFPGGEATSWPLGRPYHSFFFSSFLLFPLLYRKYLFPNSPPPPISHYRGSTPLRSIFSIQKTRAAHLSLHLPLLLKSSLTRTRNALP